MLSLVSNCTQPCSIMKSELRISSYASTDMTKSVFFLLARLLKENSQIMNQVQCVHEK